MCKVFKEAGFRVGIPLLNAPQNSPEIVRELRRRHEEDGIPGIQLADEFELDTATVYNILNRKTRADVD